MKIPISRDLKLTSERIRKTFEMPHVLRHSAAVHMVENGVPDPMTIQNCDKCGGTHYPYILKPCVVCGVYTIYACSDCAINSAGNVIAHVCERAECRDKHERTAHA